MSELFISTYTDPVKSSINSPFLKIEDQIFLSRKFRLEDGVVYAPLDLDAIFTMLRFIRKSDDNIKQLQQNVLMAKQELVMYPEKEMLYYEQLIDDALSKVNILSECPSCTVIKENLLLQYSDTINIRI
jgi:hypothetical protein